MNKQTQIPKANKILIVDDNPKNLQVLSNILAQNNYQIEFATNGRTALDWIDQEKFDMLLLDVVMPDISGFDVCKQVRKSSKFNNVPIIFLSAHNDRKTIHYGFSIGAQDFVSKPFDSSELLMRVSTHLTLKNNIQELEQINGRLEQIVEERTKELKTAKELAENSDQLKTIFLQNLSHEIRTPLNGILGFAQLLKDNLEDPNSIINYIDIIEKSGERMLTMINDLVNISRIESGEPLIINGNEIIISDLFNELYSFFKSRIEEKGLRLYYLSDIPQETTIIADKEKLFQVFTNLINNAIKFTDEGSIELSAQLKNNLIEFSIKDTGIGIASELHDVIFERFIQGNMHYNRPYEGSGLGLSISKSFIEAMGGHIWVESVKDKGSTFKFDIPI
nr:hybrid sensor histidine kinase/response regulator [uncultured Carboxylicivirga sp.]